MLDHDRRERRSKCLEPTVANGVEIGAEADAINLAATGETRDKHGAVVFPALLNPSDSKTGKRAAQLRECCHGIATAPADA